MRTTRTRWQRWLYALWLPLWAACSGGSGVPDAATMGAGVDGSLAVVQLERWAEGPQAASHLLSQAKVARFAGADGTGVERLLGGHGLEVESCGLASELPDALAHGAVSVELLDVGTIVLDFGEMTQRLQPRVFPAVGGAAHGVFYAADVQAPQPQADVDEYLVSAPGVGAVGAFDVALPPPSMVEDARLAGDTLGAGRAVVLERAGDAELTWGAVDPRDRVEVELAAGGEVLTCVARDDGHFVIPEDELAALPADDGGQLTVRRVRLLPFDMQGVEVAYVRAVTAWTEPLVVR